MKTTIKRMQVTKTSKVKIGSSTNYRIVSALIFVLLIGSLSTAFAQTSVTLNIPNNRICLTFGQTTTLTGTVVNPVAGVKYSYNWAISPFGFSNTNATGFFSITPSITSRVPAALVSEAYRLKVTGTLSNGTVVYTSITTAIIDCKSATAVPVNANIALDNVILKSFDLNLLTTSKSLNTTVLNPQAGVVYSYIWQFDSPPISSVPLIQTPPTQFTTAAVNATQIPKTANSYIMIIYAKIGTQTIATYESVGNVTHSAGRDAGEEETTSVIPVAEQPAAINFNAYPNPSNGEFTVETNFESVPEASIQIFNIGGQLVAELKNEAITRTNSFNLTQQPAGTYFIRVINSNQVVNKKMLIVK